jgi:hypothetical protein
MNAIDTVRITPTPEEAIAAAIAEYKAADTKLREFEAVKKAIKDNIERWLADLGLTGIKVPTGSVTWTAESTTVSYNAAALDALAASNDEYRRILAPHRKVSTRAGSLMIR